MAARIMARAVANEGRSSLIIVIIDTRHLRERPPLYYEGWLVRVSYRISLHA
jgi:hypothetical protein